MLLRSRLGPVGHLYEFDGEVRRKGLATGTTFVSVLTRTNQEVARNTLGDWKKSQKLELVGGRKAY